ncbi:RagB/SusD family nutrient uptake outer membrane protein [Flavivirga amylovorans]|uniref:RagB/SusD family nutrient uptake outer membrane protein n=1 Tax=Flavivirga amylovorans TaxID=870486 RepID=A0ABT8X2R3_9FLAO|nr:RagB/SusD family nutrient uptake outer membrane protein [Flavivirga amylovorans]MDO5988249.1 RagB/SusD family nutrient uptake outer membrane protein [Flavivirga amylovorans]
MKISNKIKFLAIIIVLGMTSSCSLEDGESLNGPQTTSISEGISRPELPQVVAGILSNMRDRIHTQRDVLSVLGREYWVLQSSDPGWGTELAAGLLSDGSFFINNPYAERYATVKECNLLLQSLEAESTQTIFTTNEIAAIRGFANTIKAHQLLSVLNMVYQNGIRTDVADPDNLGPFESYDAALTTIMGLLDSGFADITTGGEVSPNTLGVTYSEFNRAITARVAMYQGDNAKVLNALADSFMDMTGDLNAGAYLIYSAAGADQLNQLFVALNSPTAGAKVAYPDFVDPASFEAGDTRVNKAVARTGGEVCLAGMCGTHDVWIYQSNIDPIGLIRNEELLLLYAEANMVSNPGEAEAAIDVIRAAGGLGAVGAGNVDEDRIIYERRYSLFGEGHRWIDMRRFGRLADINQDYDRAGDLSPVPSQFPIPQSEGQ